MTRLTRALLLCATVALAAPVPVLARIGTVPLGRTSWFWSSTPTYDTHFFPPPSGIPSEHADLEWYNARGVQKRDLDPTLLDAEGGDNEHLVLELHVKQAVGDTMAINESNWTGITQSLSPVGLDLTRFHYLEVWLNDFRPYPNHETQGTLYIDLGLVSEDAFWDPRNPPNGILDTEDKNGDGKLDRSDDLALDEDTGLDGVHSVNELGYNSQINRDPNGDDYYFNPDQTPLDYSGINNMERNGTGEQTARPDTEDLNRDGFADFHNGYFQAALNLASDRFVQVDVTRDYGPIEETLEHPLDPLNGWRRYRIPLTDEAFNRVGFASWENVQHIRLWMRGMNSLLKLQIGGIELLDEFGRSMPRTPVVHQNVPNPFNPGTTIRFELPEPGRVRVLIYDAHGRLVRALVDDDRPTGYYSAFWNGENGSGHRVASGVYWYRVELPGASSQSRKMVLAR